MTSSSFRLSNLLLAIEQHGSMVALSEVVGMSPQQLSQLKNGTRGIGHKTARKLEEKLGMPPGSFDLPPAGSRDALVSTLEALTPEERVAVLSNAIDDLSPDGARILAQKLLARLAQTDE